MRQQLRDEFEEAGAVYALRVPAFLRAGHRFPGRTAVYEIPPDRSLEIDDEPDFAVAETLLRRRLQRDKAAALPRRVEAVVMDFDGVLTDNRVHVGEGGAEAVTCHRGDGWAMARLRRQGVHLLVLTGEANAVVRRRTEKLGVECIVTDEKLPVLQAWLRRRRIGPEATVYVGNDVPDVPCMAWAGCGVAPADAWPEARAAARIVLDTPGGRGCIRELAQLLGPGTVPGAPGRRRLPMTPAAPPCARPLSPGGPDFLYVEGLPMQPPFVVAEIGCNHRGELSTAEEMIRIAASVCRVDAVKFQKRSPRSC